MVEQLGYIGALMLAICALPQAIMSLREGNSYGLSHGFLWLWYLGEIFTIVYIIDKLGTSGPLFLNYATNIGLITIIMYYKYFPRGPRG